MKTKQYIAAFAVAMLPLITSNAQTASTSVATQSTAYPMSFGAAEVEKLAESGFGDEVILSYIGQTKTYFTLTADDILELKNAGVSPQAVAAMLNHDSALRDQQQAFVSSTPSTTTQYAAATTAPSDSGAVAVPPPAPALQTEVIPVAPAPDYIWTPGYWSLSGVTWVWVGGYWHYPVRPGHVWVGGYWSGHGHSRAWVRGHWR